MTAETSGIVASARRCFRTHGPEGVASAYVFGSRGRDEAHRESDLAVGVVFDRELLPDADGRSRASIDLAGEQASRRGRRFQGYAEAIRALDDYDEVPDELVRRVAPLPGFRNVLVHEYGELDYGRVLEAIRDLEPVEEFARIAARIERDPRHGDGEPD